MRTVIVFNHPYEGSYCKAILNAITKGLQKSNHEVDLMHLDNDGFKVMGYKNLNWISFTSVKSVSQKKRENCLCNLEKQFSTFN